MSSYLDRAYQELERALSLPDDEVIHEVVAISSILKSQRYADADLRTWSDTAARRLLERGFPIESLIHAEPLDPARAALIFSAADTELVGLWPAAPLSNLVEVQLGEADIDWTRQPRCSWPNLRTVYCWSGPGVANGLFSWLSEQDLPSLRELRASDSGLTAADLRRLLESSYWSRLERIRISRNELGPGDFPWPSSQALRELDLERVGADDEGLRSLLRAGLPSLRSLDIGGNQVSLAGLRSLVEASLPQLARLGARGNWFADDSIWDVLAGGFWPQLRSLDINGDGSQPERLIPAQGLFAAISHLNLSSCRLGDAGADALSATAFSRLESLRLAYNRIGVRGARALVRATLPDLVDLDLSVNELGDEGLRFLVEARWWHQLERLTLVNNQLTEASLAHLAERLPLRIQEVDVGSPHGVGAEALSRLRDALAARRGRG